DLLPMPYTEESLAHTVARVKQVQDYLERPIMLENPSSYAEFTASTMSECDFLVRLAEEADCGLLLDVNNVHVSCTNHGGDAAAYIDAFPTEHVGEIHLAGHAVEIDDDGRPLLIDAHDREIVDPIWVLYRRALECTGPVPTLIEWDNDVPEWQTLYGEALLAEAWLRRSSAERDFAHAAAV
ncbi:MAG: DUF692 domain-containing protein, partial [Hyphomicrobiales bacterium]|nr:DUF692 domain-containing protein [Hyphomicrobiales bacterium]